MALSDRDCRHGRQIGKCADCDLDHMEMAADAEARRVDELTALRKQDTELIRQLVEALETVDDAMPYPVARQVQKVARARLEGMHAYDDEILWWSGVSVKHDGLCVTKVPFVFGFFVAKLTLDYDTGNCTYPVAGPFRSLHTAIAAIALIS